MESSFEQYFTVVLFVFQLNFGLGTVRSERVNPLRSNSDQPHIFLEISRPSQSEK